MNFYTVTILTSFHENDPYVSARVCQCLCVCVCVCVAVNSYGCYTRIVNYLTDCNTWLLFFKFVSFYFGIVCVRRCVCLCVAVNSNAYCIWIVNDITECNTCLFSVAGFFCFRKACVRKCVCLSVCICVSQCVCMFSC